MAKQLRADGWLDSELLAYMLNTEEVNPALPEAVGIANMEKIGQAVHERLIREAQ